MGAGDDQHGDGADHGLVALADERPHQHGHSGGGHSHIEQDSGGSVGEHLGT